MNQIKVFKTDNKSLLLTQNEINTWAEENNFNILQVSTTNGATFTAKNSTYVLEVEIFIVVLYSKND